MIHPVLAGAFVLSMHGPILAAGAAIAVMSSALSPLVVLKRLSFVGQGISHAAFGGVGIAAVLAAIGGITSAEVGGTLQFPVVMAFCLACAVLIAWLTERGAAQADTAIGIVLVASMALGVLLISWASLSAGRAVAPGWESLLFGSIATVDALDAGVAWAVCALILGAGWYFRRTLLFWAFDEPAAPAFGIPAQSMKYLLVVLLTLAIVTSMKLAGVVLASALLVLPGATALRASERLVSVFAISVLVGLLGVLGGLLVAFVLDRVPPGACIVTALIVLFIAARLLSRVQSGRSLS